MSQPITKAKVRLTSAIDSSSSTVSFTAVDPNRALESVTMSDFGTYAYIVVNPAGKIGNYEVIRFASWSVSGSTITVGTLTRNLSLQGVDSANTGLSFAAGTLAIISTNHHWFNNVVLTEGAQTIAGVKTFSSFPITPSASPTTNYQVANKAYVDGVSIAGAPDASDVTKGITKLSVAAVSATAPIAVGDNDTRVPTQGENDGLAATTTPSSTNLFITQKDSQKAAETYAADAGANDTYVITLSPVPAAYTTGMLVTFKANTINTGAATINVNSLGAKSITKNGTTALEDGDIKVGQVVTLRYDGTQFQMQGVADKISTANATTLTGGASSDAQTLHTHNNLSHRIATMNQVAISSTTTETTVLTATVPANLVGTANALRFYALLDSFVLANTKQLTIRLKYGGSTVATLSIVDGEIGSAIKGELVGLITGSGATNTQICTLRISCAAESADSIGAGTVAWLNSGAGAVDTTSSQTFAVTAQFNQASAANGITFLHGYLEFIGA